jgi:hypothetical protein
MSRPNRMARGQFRNRVSMSRPETEQAPAAEAHGVPAKPHATVRWAQAQVAAPQRGRDREKVRRAGVGQARVTAAAGPSARQLPAQRAGWRASAQQSWAWVLRVPSASAPAAQRAWALRPSVAARQAWAR